MAKLKQHCHACGQKYAEADIVCPRCNVSRKGDVNKPMVAAYGFFLLLMLVLGTATIVYMQNVTHVH